MLRISKQDYEEYQKKGIISDVEKAIAEKRYRNWEEQNKYRGWREINGEKLYFLNRMEANLYRYFVWQKQQGIISDVIFCNGKHHQKYHTFSFPNNKGTYRPDFWIIQANGIDFYIESKGYFSRNDKVKMNKMNKFYPDINIRIIMYPEYKNIERQVRAIIKGWE